MVLKSGVGRVRKSSAAGVCSSGEVMKRKARHHHRSAMLGGASALAIASACFLAGEAEAQTFTVSDGYVIWNLDGADGGGLEVCPPEDVAAGRCAWNAIDVSSIPIFDGTVFNKLAGWGRNGLELSYDHTTGYALNVQSNGGKGDDGNTGNVPGVTQSSAGAPGGDGGNITLTLSGTGNLTCALFCPAILVEANGGDGGRGGGGEWGSSGEPGGLGGRGGNITIESSRNLTVRATGILDILDWGARGIFAQANGGRGGDGGDGDWLGGGGGGGAPTSTGGNISVTNSGTIQTIASGFSDAIYVQSIGGFGGGGGDSSGLWGSGGDGGHAGRGGNVSVTNSGALFATGFLSRGIFAQSVGGGGGNGGSASGIYALGGDGGSGGDGGLVDVTHLAGGSIWTDGHLSDGIFAQSVGGGGGTGGSAASVTLSIGGSGGQGGDGASVYVASSGSIDTSGTTARGIFAQSVGGGGGNGGNAISVGAIVSVAIGATGGSGGDGNSVEIALGETSQIHTRGAGAHGVQAQSVGGGGGDGGQAISVALDPTLVAGSISAALGGSGAAGGSGDAVIVDNDGSIRTDGNWAYGVFLQSVGGGGGNGGGAVSSNVSAGLNLSATLGGEGRVGGRAGNVYYFGDGNIETRGVGSHGIMAQSVAGGGGNGGYAIGGTLGGLSASVRLGGSGGNGNAAGDVHVINGLDPDVESHVFTFGLAANGIYAQSVGGGGGNGGLAGNLAISAGNFGLTLAGSGGAGGEAGDVGVRNGAAVSTHGGFSTAIFAQSVGGGGGNGGGALSAGAGIVSLNAAIGGEGGSGHTGGLVTVENSGRLNTFGSLSAGIIAQSVGGGGGNGGFAVSGGLGLTAGNVPGIAGSISIGGKGGVGAMSDQVTVRNSGEIITYGDLSSGVFAQSVGGGGGNGGWAGALSAGQSAGLSVSIGGSGGWGGSSGDVLLENSGTVYTAGRNSVGLWAQSVGGGGGNGGFALSGTAGPMGSKNFAFSLGGNGGTGGFAGNVHVRNGNARVHTNGEGSHAIFAHSIGGGGGNGGFAANGMLALSGPSVTTVNLALAIGGDGGDGGHGGDIIAENAGQLITMGRGARGIFAQSVGGGGGNGGLAFNGLNTINGDQTGRVIHAGIAIGGTGGSGNLGGDVTVNQSGNIGTLADGSAGILAQSIGGGGGTGGDAGSLSLILGRQCTLLLVCSPDSATQNNINLELLIGGKGGRGNHGGDVTVVNSGLIQTNGIASHGIHAHSIGAGGGVGGDAIIGLGNFVEDPVAIGGTLLYVPFSQVGILSDWRFGLGGSGGASGDGGDVLVENSSIVIINGDRSSGIVAQSVGGGGGSGGNSVVGVTGKVGIGGVSGASGDGGEVVVSSGEAGIIITYGDLFSHGIFAQSVGGGGGQGGAGSGLINIGGGRTLPDYLPDDIQFLDELGSAGNGGNIRVDNAGHLSTSGDMSMGIIAQSVGGGGGTGGSGASATLLSTGGTGGSAGDGGDVSVEHSGYLVTQGIGSTGIFAQSVGGGGGLAGSTGDLTFIANGGSGGAAGDGGDVRVSSSGQVVTLGQFAHAIHAQSVGGGGGSGSYLGAATVLSVGGEGGASGDGGRVSIDHSGLIFTAGNGAHGLFGQSVGGGGGASSTSTSLARIGGGGSASGNGGDITITQADSAYVQTSGTRAHGIMAQSVGGGGGSVGGMQSAFQFDLQEDGAVGHGGDITLVNDGDITVVGIASAGILAQSVGGQGGDFSADDINPVFDGVRPSDGDGGDIFIRHTGTISANGDHGIGILAQSVAGGGGLVGNLGGLEFAGSLNGDGLAGRIDIETENAYIRATGEGGYGIWAQSDSAQDDASITLTLIDTYIRGGSGSGRGIFVDGNGSNSIFFSGFLTAVSGWVIETTDGDDTFINAGNIYGNIDLGGGSNRFENLEGAYFLAGSTIDLRDPSAVPQTPSLGGGPVSQKAPVMEAGPQSVGYSVRGPVMAELVEPFMTGSDAGREPALLQTDVLGQAGLETGGVTRSAKPGPVMAVLEDVPTGFDLEPDSRATLAMSDVADATFRNSGTFLMGLTASRYPLDLLNGERHDDLDGSFDPTYSLYNGIRYINTLELDGHFEQTATGHLIFDIAFGPYASDIVNVSGAATVDGTGQVILTWLENAERQTLFAAEGGGVDHGLDIADTLAIDYSIEADADGIHLVMDPRFGIDSLNRNGQALGDHLDSALRAGEASELGRLLAYLGNMDVLLIDAYHHVFETLDPQAHLAVSHSQLASANSFSSDLFNCGGPVSRPGDQCVWTELEMARQDREATTDSLAVESDALRFSGGVEQGLGRDWSLAVAVSYGNTQSMRIGDDARASGEGLAVGVGLERSRADGAFYGAAFSAGWSWWESSRAMSLWTPGTGTSAPETGYARIDLHIGDTFRRGSLFARPQVRASVTALHHNGLVETGLGAYGVEVLSDDSVIGTINPQFTLGHVFRDRDDLYGVVAVSGGVRYSSQDRLELPMRLLGTNPAADPALIGNSMDDLVYEAGVSLEVAGNDRIGLSLGYDAEFGEKTDELGHRAGFDLRLRF